MVASYSNMKGAMWKKEESLWFRYGMEAERILSCSIIVDQCVVQLFHDTLLIIN